jgi:hypothetical protein
MENGNKQVAMGAHQLSVGDATKYRIVVVKEEESISG